MNENDELKHIEKKIERYSKICMSEKVFKNIHQNLMNATNSYYKKERRGVLMKKISISFCSFTAVLVVLILFFSGNNFKNTDDKTEQVNRDIKATENFEAEERQDKMKSASTEKKSIEELKEETITEVLEKYPHISRKELKARIGKIIDVDGNNNTILFEGEVSKGMEGRILFTLEDNQLIDKTLVGKKVLTVGYNLLFYSNPYKGTLYKVIVITD